ncbi:HNH endonuclease [Vibrio harveyi]
MWKWDQGRLQYSKIEKVYALASTLSELNGISIDEDPEGMKDKLITGTGLSFSAGPNGAWRNYARTIRALGLASEIQGKLQITEVCKRLASNGEAKLTPNDYLTHISKVFSYPAACFKDYTPSDHKIFPIAAIIKYLIAKGLSGVDPTIDSQEVSSVLIGNNVTGLENIDYYKTLKTTSHSIGAEIRQVRELLAFISQFSFLSYTKSELSLDTLALASFDETELNELFSPIVITSEVDRDLEIQKMFSLNLSASFDIKEAPAPEDLLFTEGKKQRTNHLRIERSKDAIKAYFNSFTNIRESQRCDVCKVIVSEQYPWMEKLIEVHHLLPLSSPLHSHKQGTTLNDLVGLCPNCHRATHSYYRKFLKERGLEDFVNEDQARDVYQQMKERFVAH